MKILIALFFTMACAVCRVRAAAAVVTIGESVYEARSIDLSALLTTSGPLVFGGLGETPGVDWLGRVVLLDRGIISMSSKLANVEQGGGVAMVIINNEPGSLAVSLDAGKTSMIPAVVVSQSNGPELKAKIGSFVRVGSPAPRPTLPDPAGHAGEFMKSDGEKYVFAKLPDAPPAVAMASELAVGQRLAFTVSANGSPPLTYQWMKDGANIAGATAAAFVIAAVTPADAGTFVCQVSNANGAAPSAAHNITIK